MSNCYRVSIDRRQIGFDNEDRGVRFLSARGYQVLERNYRTPFGEIDIVAREKDMLVCVEVKYRRGTLYGQPQEALTRNQQKRIVRSALHYIKAKGCAGTGLRFDVLAIGPGDSDIELISAAFSGDGYTY